MSKVAIELFEPRSFDAGVADEIVALVEETLDGAEFCSIALSGGSTPAGVYRALSKPPRVDQVDWSRLKVFWSDDRFVPHSDSQSNYRLAYETLLSQLSPGPQVFAVDITQSTAELAAESYQRSLIREVPCDGDGVPELDIVLLGMGTDGHTASLFPGAESSHALCLATCKDGTDSKRVSFGIPLIARAKHVVFIVKGEGKADMAQRVIEGSSSVKELPARVFAEARGRVTWFLDTAAASKLST